MTKAQVAMTLSSIAYAQNTNDVNCLLADPSYATKNQWELVWGVGNKKSNQMFLVKQKGTHNYIAAIRGTVTNIHSHIFFKNWFENLDVIKQKDWPYTIDDSGKGAKISNGTNKGLIHLMSMESNGMTLLQYVQQHIIPSEGNICVTGHSMGGCLATVYALWLQYKLSKIAEGTINAITFAAPTAGNQAFADYYTKKLKLSQRYYNKIDVVPMCYSHIGNIKKLYAPPAPKCDELLKILIDAVKMGKLEKHYAQTNGKGTSLDGTPQTTSDFYKEVDDQHAANNYLTLLGANPVKLSSA